MHDDLFGQRKITVVSAGESTIYIYFLIIIIFILYLKEIKYTFELFKQSGVFSF